MLLTLTSLRQKHKVRDNKMHWAKVKEIKSESQIELPISLLIRIIHTRRVTDPEISPGKSSGGYDLTSQRLCSAHILSVCVGLIFTERFYVTTFDNNTSKLIEQ